MCKSTQDLTIWLSRVAQKLKIADEDISIQIYADKSFRLYVHTRQEDPVYDSDEDEGFKSMDINDLIYEDPEEFGAHLIDVLSDATSELNGKLSVGEAIQAIHADEEDLKALGIDQEEVNKDA